MRLLFLGPLLFFASALPLTAQTATRAAATLPTVTAYALDKSKVTLPADLAGISNILVFYFQPDQAEAALAWVNSIATFRSVHPGVKSYILPVYSKENFLYRWWIDASTRSAAPPSQDWHTTIPIFVDKASYFKAVGIQSEKEPFVLLTDKAGHIRWRIQGTCEQWRVDQLASQMVSVPQGTR